MRSRAVFPCLVLVLLILSICSGVVFAEYRTISKTEIVSIGSDPSGNYTRLENIADPEHNTTFNSQSWTEFLNITENETWSGHDLAYSSSNESGWAGEGLTLVESENYISSTGILYRWGCYLNKSGFLQLKVFRENATHFNFVGESKMVYGSVGENYFNCRLSVREDDIIGVFLPAGDLYELADLCYGSSVDKVYYNWSNIDENYNKTNMTYQTGYTMIRVGVRAEGYNRTNYGHFIGALLPESPFTFNTSLTSSPDRLMFGTYVKFDAGEVGSGISEMWIRSPYSYNHNNLQTMRIKIYHLNSLAFFNVSYIGTDDFELDNVTSPVLIFDHNYSFGSSYSNRRVFQSSDNRAFYKVMAPIYPDQYYFIGFQVTDFKSDNVTLYWSLCDMNNDGLYYSYFGYGDYEAVIEAELGLSYFITEGMGHLVSGYELDTRVNTSNAWVEFYTSINTTLGNGDYLTYTWPFITPEGETLDIYLIVWGVHDNGTVGEALIATTYYNNSKALIVSEQITCTYNYSRFKVHMAILKPQQYDNKVSDIPIVSWYMYDSNNLWLNSRNDTWENMFRVFGIFDLASLNETVHFRLYHTISKTSGDLDLYERPFHVYYIFHEERVEGSRDLSPWEFIIGIGDGILYYLGVVYDYFIEGVTTVGGYLYGALKWVYDRIVDALGGLGAWLWDNVGVHIYYAVTFAVNAFVNAMITFIQIMLFLIPIGVFILFVTFWYKILRGFKIWYKQGYTAFALYMETEMIKVFTMIQGSWNLLRMKKEQRRKLIIKQLRKKIRELSAQERRIYVAERRKVTRDFGLLDKRFHTVPRTMKRPKGKVRPRARKNYYTKPQRARRVVRVKESPPEDLTGWKWRDVDKSDGAKSRYKNQFATKKKPDDSGWKWKTKGERVNG